MSRLEGRGAPRDPAALFAALGDATRLSVLETLCDGRARSISQLAAGSPITRQGLSKHLRVLEEAGVVASERIGREQRYRVRRQAFDDAKAYLERASARWDDALERLRMLVEDEDPLA
jgi:DNA-binding transcriptional ArsR family regulator